MRVSPHRDWANVGTGGRTRVLNATEPKEKLVNIPSVPNSFPRHSGRPSTDIAICRCILILGCCGRFLSLPQPYQNQARVGVNVFLKMRRAFRHNLAGRPNMCFEKMAAVRSTIFLAYYCMCVDDWLSFIQRDIPNERQELNLFVESHRGFVFLGLPAKPAQADRAQGRRPP
jgi:hypothetical protein